MDKQNVYSEYPRAYLFDYRSSDLLLLVSSWISIVR